VTLGFHGRDKARREGTRDHGPEFRAPSAADGTLRDFSSSSFSLCRRDAPSLGLDNPGPSARFGSAPLILLSVSFSLSLGSFPFVVSSSVF